MTIRKNVAVLENIWNDAQRVSQEDMETEQNRNNQIDSAIINNHFGSGILPSSAQQNVLWDSDTLDVTQAALLAAGIFDGTGLSVATQPSDINLGNQLEVELTDSAVFGRLSVKIAIIGLAFDDTVQMDRFYFYRNEKQVTAKHYKRILTIFTNDFKGNQNCSRTLGGRLVIRETASFQLSRDPLMVAQDVDPDLFWRDFKLASLGDTLQNQIQTGMGSEFSVDALNINTTGLPSREIDANDVTTQIGQKFKAQTNNIQKITLLLSVSKTGTDDNTEFDWTGDIVVSIYPLQTTVSCPTDIIPELAIDFDPNNVPLSQVSFNQTTLKDYGYVLNTVLQPIDFVFSSTLVGTTGTNSVISKDKYYVVTIKRSGAANSGTIFVGTGNHRVEDSRLTVFNSVWVDVPENDLWFQVWTDAAKVADGQAYDAGNGIMISKTAIDGATGATIDYAADQYPFADSGENILNTAVIQAIFEGSVTVQDERTGNPINSRQEFSPSFSFVTTSGLQNLQNVSEPLIIGAMQDTNPKSNPIVTKTQSIPGLVHGDVFCIVNPDADLLSLNLLGSKFYPNKNGSSDTYRIFKTTLCTDGYGDVNGDGKIDSLDITKATTLIGEGIALAATQQKIANGQIDTLELIRADVDGDGYVTTHDVDLITNYVSRSINAFPVGSTFTHMCLQVQQSIGRSDGYFDCDGYVRLDGYGGTNIIDPGSLTPQDLIYDGYLLIPSMEIQDHTFLQVPFPGTTYQIVPQPFWQPYLLMTSSKAREVPASFTSNVGIPDHDCTTAATFSCADKNAIVPDVSTGRNDFYIPDNLLIKRGDILRPDGSFYKVDFEIGTVILQLPQIPLSESSINIMDKFVVDRGDGFTNASYLAMRYADCSTVQAADLALGRVRFSVSLQSFAPNLDGYSLIDGYGAILDDLVGIYLDPTTGILKLTIKDLSVDPVFMTLVTKIQILVYLKKAGWNNTPLIIQPTEIQGLISS